MPSGDKSWVRSWWGWFVIWLICLASGAALAGSLGTAGYHPWAGLPGPRISFYQGEQCEPIDTCGFFVQKANFWSNYAYLFAGMMILLLHDQWIGRYVGLAFIFLAITSGWYHGTISELGQTLDIVGVNVATLALLSYGSYAFLRKWRTTRLEPDDPAAWFLHSSGFVLGVIAAVYRSDAKVFGLKVFDSTNTSVVLGGLILVLMLLAFFLNLQHWQIWLPRLILMCLAIGAMGTAMYFKFSDGGDTSGNPKSIFTVTDCYYVPIPPTCRYNPGWYQGHALWHLFSGLTFVFAFEFFRVGSESRSVFIWAIVIGKWVYGLCGGKPTAAPADS